MTLAHRRLAVVDLSEHAAQPMHAAGWGALVYNGELYNDEDVRRDLASNGVEFRTRSDTETVLAALGTWGQGALTRLRGMFALAWHAPDGRVLLARDALGMKPLYWRRANIEGREHVLFASEVPALLGLPGVSDAPDPVGVSAYLTTIRTTLGERTMYEGVRALEPGWAMWVEPAEGIVRRTAWRWSGLETVRAETRSDDTRTRITDSVRRHWRADVPVCVLLSGGLDSTVIAALAARDHGRLRTYAAGAAESREDPTSDLAFARLAAARLGSAHTEVLITRDAFATAWPEMVERLGVPLSTPNEVAIRAVSRRLRGDGMIVALSGEGADELLGGYDTALSAVGARGGAEDGTGMLRDAAWIEPGIKPTLLTEEAWTRAEADEALQAFYRGAYREAAVQNVPEQAALRMLRRINLAGLLGRLDTATMLEGVEGRTPFADVEVAAWAESLAIRDKYDPARPAPNTKLALRCAFEAEVPAEIMRRSKASFPLPFQVWCADHVAQVQKSGWLRTWFRPEVLEAVTGSPQEAWRFAWPLINLALWGRRWD